MGDFILPGLTSYELRYVKKAVGRALNECLTDVLLVRPVDPVEFMGLWMRRYVDIRKYYKNKREYFKNLVQIKESEDSMNRLSRRNFKEAVETTRHHLATKLDELEKKSTMTSVLSQGTTISRTSNKSINKLKVSRTSRTKILGSKENTPVSTSATLIRRGYKTEDDQSMKLNYENIGVQEIFDDRSRKESKTKSHDFPSSSDLLMASDSVKSRHSLPDQLLVFEQRRESLLGNKKLNTDDLLDEEKRPSVSRQQSVVSLKFDIGSKKGSISSLGKLSSHSSATGQWSKLLPAIEGKGQKKQLEKMTPKTGESEVTSLPSISSLNTSSISAKIIPGNVTSNLTIQSGNQTDIREVFVETWRAVGSTIVCVHPVLGNLLIKKPPVDHFSNDWLVKKYAIESFYDEELYTNDSYLKEDFSEDEGLVELLEPGSPKSFNIMSILNP